MNMFNESFSLDFVKYMFPRFLSPRPPFFFVPFVLKGERGKGGGVMCGG
jgi:hypothetical protein